METAETVLTDALQEIGVRAVESPLEADEIQTAIRYMNRYMAQLAVKGVNLGYTQLSNLASPVTIPDGAVNGLIGNTAIFLAGQFSAPVSQSLIALANEGEEAMYLIGTSIIPSTFGNTTPIGSGNESDSVLNRSPFYPKSDEAILSESGNFIATETGTE